jgi:transcriptional regulator with XRE-family HTH domain
VSWKRNRLRVLRAERRITQHKLAKRIGMSQGQYCRTERAEREPTPEELEKLARALKVEVAVITGEAVPA